MEGGEEGIRVRNGIGVRRVYGGGKREKGERARRWIWVRREKRGNGKRAELRLTRQHIQ